MARTLNVFSVAAVVALPLTGAWVVSRDGRAGAALLCTAWLASLNSDFGGGPQGMFHYGLLNQQVGLCLFVAFSHALVARCDLRRAGLWLGVIALTHQHTLLVAGIVWAVTGATLPLLRARGRRGSACEGVGSDGSEDRPRDERDGAGASGPSAVEPPPGADVREWLAASALALVIAAPTVLGLWHGMANRGAFTGFVQPPLYEQLMAGVLVAPWPTIAAVALVVAGGALAVRTLAAAGRYAVWITVGVVLTALSLQFTVTGIAVLDPVLRYVLRLRTLGYAACWWAVVAAVAFAHTPRMLRWAAVALTAAGVALGWQHHDALGARMRQAHAGGRPYQSASSRAYGALLNDLRRTRGAHTYTVALVAHPKPAFRHPFQRLTHVVRQPALGGHGVELSAVRNVDLVYRLTALPCAEVRRQVRVHAVGAFVGHASRALEHLDACLPSALTVRRHDWWAVRTGVGWHNFDARVRAFTRNATWTTLRWDLAQPSPRPQRLRLPVAATAPWRATTDAGPAEVARGPDRLLTVSLPPGARRVTLEYAGHPGEWLSVAASACALLLAAARARRRRAPQSVAVTVAGRAVDDAACKPARARVL